MNIPKTFMAALAFALLGLVVIAVADDTVTPQTQTQAQTGHRFIDVDGDGICDNAGLYGKGSGNGAGFIDADGDGVCDNKAAGTGKGLKRGQGFRGRHANFIDRDGDGVCDNKGKGYTNSTSGLKKGNCNGAN